MKVLLRAPLLTNSGYGVHSRQVFEWLYEKGFDLDVECLNWGMTPWVVNGEYEEGLIKKIMNCSKKLSPPYDITFQLQLPDEWDPKLGKFNVGMSAIVETDTCNPKWVDACNQMDHIIVPSNFTKNVLKRSGILLKPISVIPEWFNQNIKIDDAKNKSLIDFKTDFNFLIISQLNSQNPEDDRKNIFNTIKWICEEFKDNKDIGIVLKTNLGRGTTIDKKMTKALLTQMINLIGKKEFPKIYLIHGNMESNEIAELYNHDSIKCAVSATRGEGFGLPLIDAAAAGIPVVATNWSGHLDFLSDRFVKINYNLKEIREEKSDDRIFFKGFRWAEPDEKDFKFKISKIYENYEKFKNDSKILKKDIHANFSKIAIKKIYDTFFNDLRK